MRISSILTLLASLPTVLAHTDRECYQLPVVIVSAIDHSFPEPTCNQMRYPAADCLKAPVQTRLEVIDNDPGTLNCIHGEPTAVFNHSTSNYRGQTSLFFPKHQFNIKFHDATSFLGMVENKAFVMNGPFLDCTLLRNHLAHWLFRSTGRYSVKTRHVVVYMRTSPSQAVPQYFGIYLLLEKPTYDRNHVNLASLNAKCAALDPTMMTGGWAWANDPPSYNSYSPNLVIDQYQNEFGMGERPVLMHPSGASLSQQMRDYFVNTATGFLPQMYRVLWHNMTTPLELQKHLDLGSFADYLLHTEMSLNVDAYRRSTFFFKDRDQPINAGPVWDFNLAYGNGARRNFQDWVFPQYTYWKRLMCNSQLTSLVIQRWKTLRGTNSQKADDPVFGIWTDEAITSFINASSAPLHQQLSKCRGGNWRSDVVQCAMVDLKTCNGTYTDQVTDLLESVLNRAKWMDREIDTLYKQLDAMTCSGVGDLPKYNCGLDGNDDGCLKNPEKYYNAVSFPPIRKPFTGRSCEELVTKTAEFNGKETAAEMTPYEKPSIDYCWQSAGSYVYPQQKGVKDKSLTPFCSGYGTCHQGPGATCNCSVAINVEHPSCRRIDAENEHYNRIVAATTKGITVSTVEGTHSSHSPISDFIVVVAAAVAGITLLVFGSWIVSEQRRRRHHGSDYVPVRYGSTDHARIFQEE